MSSNADAVDQLTRALDAVPRLKELARRSPERVVGSREFQQWREDAVGSIADVFGKRLEPGQVVCECSVFPEQLLFRRVQCDIIASTTFGVWIRRPQF